MAALDIPELETIKEMLERALDQRTVPEWYTLEHAYRIKFGDPELGPALMTIKRNRALQPRAGIPDGWQQSRKVWHRETIEQWVKVDDVSLAGYLAQVAPRVPVPAFIRTSLAKKNIDIIETAPEFAQKEGKAG